jgi:SAM-dependent methyltransferase
MFHLSADIYDLVYKWKDYKRESSEISAFINQHNANCKTVLDIACGTGEHHHYLKDQFSVDGIDINKDFIAIASSKNPKGSYAVADMKDFDLGTKYDAIVCLFSSIGYLKTYTEILRALKCFRSHLNHNGLIVVEPWFTKENWEGGKTHMLTHEEGDLRICRMTKGYPEGDHSILDFHYLVGSSKLPLRHFVERHELRMTSKEEMTKAFQEAGLNVQYVEKGLTGRGIYLARHA